MRGKLDQKVESVDKFVTNKAPEELKFDALAEHLKAAVPELPVQLPGDAYGSKPWVSWDNKQRQAAGLLFLQTKMGLAVWYKILPSPPNPPPPGRPFIIELHP